MMVIQERTWRQFLLLSMWLWINVFLKQQSIQLATFINWYCFDTHRRQEQGWNLPLQGKDHYHSSGCSHWLFLFSLPFIPSCIIHVPVHSSLSLPKFPCLTSPWVYQVSCHSLFVGFISYNVYIIIWLFICKELFFFCSTEIKISTVWLICPNTDY